MPEVTQAEIAEILRENVRLREKNERLKYQVMILRDDLRKQAKRSMQLLEKMEARLEEASRAQGTAS